jgi:hypothetical protein
MNRNHRGGQSLTVRAVRNNSADVGFLGEGR